MNLNRPETALTSDEVNFLIFKYLQESGMDHSAFVFAQESQVLNSPIVLQGDSGLPKAALVTLIQKGLQYTEIEQSLSKVDLEQEFFEKKRKKKERKDKVSKEEKAKTTSNTKQEPNTNDGESQQEKENTTKNSLTKNTDNPDFGISKTSNDSQKQDTNNLSDPKKNSNIQTNQSQTFSNPNSNFPAKIKFLENDVKILKGHTSEVFVCQWSPNGRFLASGSGDTTARIWDISYLETNNIKLDQIPSKVLKHHNLNTTVSSKDVTTLDWHPQGAFLATGSYDGIARIWREDGEIVSSLVGHKSAIFSLKWNKTGDFLLSGSLDSSVIVWDTKTNSQKQIFRKHTAPTLDVDWRTPISFASCSVDHKIHVCEIGLDMPICTFEGHTDEVNNIKWDPSGLLLASCSDDFTAKIWKINEKNCVHDLQEHTKEIYNIKWSNTGKGTKYPNKDLILSTASFDCLIKIWDIETGQCKHTLTKHISPVYSIAFSPDGEYLASGSFDKSIYIWSVKTGNVVRSYQDTAGIFEVSWSPNGDKIAGAFADHKIAILDFRM